MVKPVVSYVNNWIQVEEVVEDVKDFLLRTINNFQLDESKFIFGDDYVLIYVNDDKEKNFFMNVLDSMDVL